MDETELFYTYAELTEAELLCDMAEDVSHQIMMEQVEAHYAKRDQDELMMVMNAMVMNRFERVEACL